jgi:glycine cleavage system H protein
MSDLRYTKDHEWVRLDGDVATVGISNYAQEQLGDVVFVELPEVGRVVANGDAMAVVESVKAASDLYAPLGGEVVAVNEALPDDPAKVNSDPQGEGWFCRIRVGDRGEFDALMDEGAYQSFLDSL